jgi:formate/nitrite transporter FocA (FNT family)
VSYLVWVGKCSVANALVSVFVPTLLGNIVGGVSLVAAINHAQIVAGSGGQDV